MAAGRYFVYALFCKDAPFYIGKGSGDRHRNHVWDARMGKLSPVARRIRSIWRDGGSFEPVLLLTDLSKNVALQVETDLIRLIGCMPKGPLVNTVAAPFEHLTPEHIEKRTAPRRGVPRSPEVRAKISASKMGHSVSLETRAKLSKAAKQQRARRTEGDK